MTGKIIGLILQMKTENNDQGHTVSGGGRTGKWAVWFPSLGSYPWPSPS